MSRTRMHIWDSRQSIHRQHAKPPEKSTATPSTFFWQTCWLVFDIEVNHEYDFRLKYSPTNASASHDHTRPSSAHEHHDEARTGSPGTWSYRGLHVPGLAGRYHGYRSLCTARHTARWFRRKHQNLLFSSSRKRRGPRQIALRGPWMRIPNQMGKSERAECSNSSTT